MLRCHFYSLLLFSIALPTIVPAQTSGTSAMTGMDHSAPVKMIDGNVNPELIPDSTAYRLFFIVAGELPNAPAERKVRQAAFFKRFAFQQLDQNSICRVLETFKLKYAILQEQFNSAEMARIRIGAPSRTDQFVAQRDALVQATRDELKQALSGEGVKQLDGVVQDEKRNMKVPAEGGQ